MVFTPTSIRGAWLVGVEKRHDDRGFLLAANVDLQRCARLAGCWLHDGHAYTADETLDAICAGETPGPIGARHPSIAPFDAFPTRDRPIIIATGGDAHFRALCGTLGCPALADDPAVEWKRMEDALEELRVAVDAMLEDRLKDKHITACQYRLLLAIGENEGCKQGDLVRATGIDRSTIANLMRLLELPQVVLDALRTGLVSAGHARALLPLGDPKSQIAYCERIGREELSVREVERMVSEDLAKEDADGKPIAGAKVEFMSTSFEALHSVLSDSEGHYRVRSRTAPISSWRRTRAPRPSPIWRTGSRRTTASGWGMRSPQVGQSDTTTKPWASQRAARGRP